MLPSHWLRHWVSKENIVYFKMEFKVQLECHLLVKVINISTTYLIHPIPLEEYCPHLLQPFWKKGIYDNNIIQMYNVGKFIGRLWEFHFEFHEKN
jgi:hypothetical protein